MNTCTNCSITFTGSYCNKCGQKINSGRIYFKELIHDFFGGYFHLDSPPLLTIKTLTTNPGFLIREFIDGKRKKYHKPVHYFILAIAFYLIIRTLLHFDPIVNQYKAMGKELPSPEVMNTVPMLASSILAKNINLLLFVFVFIFSAFTKLFFRKSGYNYIEHLVFSFFTIGHYVLLSVFVMPLSFIDPKLIYLTYLVQIGYLSFSLISFHKPKIFIGILKSVVAVIFSFSIYVTIVYTAVIYYVILFLR
ncbi:MAG TPA: DUF3667 domain-containing protein [Ignavibacteriaceae bacterium]|nr:DUF3667 domain-containing protein [Ignavibacteriaceae bacterium]